MWSSSRSKTQGVTRRVWFWKLTTTNGSCGQIDIPVSSGSSINFTRLLLDLVSKDFKSLTNNNTCTSSGNPLTMLDTSSELRKVEVLALVALQTTTSISEPTSARILSPESWLLVNLAMQKAVKSIVNRVMEIVFIVCFCLIDGVPGALVCESPVIDTSQ